MRERSWFSIIYWGCVIAQGVGTLVTVAYAFGWIHGLVVTLALEALFVALHDGIEHRFDRRHTKALAVLTVYGLLFASGALQLSYARTFDATSEALARFEPVELVSLARITAASPNLALFALVSLQLLGKLGAKTSSAKSAKITKSESAKRETREIGIARWPDPPSEPPIALLAQDTRARSTSYDRSALAIAIAEEPNASSVELAERFGVSRHVVDRAKRRSRAQAVLS